MARERAPAILAVSPLARSRKAFQGSAGPLCVDHSRTPLRSKARANVGSPPCMKSIAVVVMTPDLAARLASRAAICPHRRSDAHVTSPASSARYLSTWASSSATLAFKYASRALTTREPCSASIAPIAIMLAILAMLSRASCAVVGG
jgi:hypothetical protein